MMLVDMLFDAGSWSWYRDLIFVLVEKCSSFFYFLFFIF